MDRSVVDRKLETLRRCMKRIESWTPKNPDDLEKNVDAQDIVSVNLERAVQACVDIASHILSQREGPIPDTLAGAFEALCAIGLLDRPLADRMKKAVGFRNIAVHQYEAIDWRRVYSIITNDLQDFRAFAARMNAVIDSTP